MYFLTEAKIIEENVEHLVCKFELNEKYKKRNENNEKFSEALIKLKCVLHEEDCDDVDKQDVDKQEVKEGVPPSRHETATTINNDLYNVIKDLLINVTTMDEYDGDSTPFDQYDSSCHKVHGGSIGTDEKKDVGSSMEHMTELELIFMCNLSEQAKRPKDMLMFLGEYFKEVIKHCDEIEANIKKENQKKSQEQTGFFLTMEIINSLGAACKKLIEHPR